MQFGQWFQPPTVRLKLGEFWYTPPLAGDSGMVLVTTTSSSASLWLMRSMAGPENMGCVQYA
jgi:hypothetical protein